jgi:Telomere resolvase
LDSTVNTKLILENMKQLPSPSETAQRILRTKNPDDIAQLCKDLCITLFGSGEYKPKTRANKLRPYTAIIEQFDGQLIEGQNAFCQTRRDGSPWLRHLYYREVGIASTDWDAINQESSRKVLNRLENQATELDAEKFLEVATALLSSENPWIVAAGLIALSGRRPIEILLTGDFLLEGEQLIFSGQAKKRGGEAPYPIQILGDTTRFLKAFEHFRNSPELCKVKDKFDPENPERSRRLISSSNTLKIRKQVIQYFSWMPRREGKKFVGCSDLRAAWARIASNKHCPPGTEPLLWVSRQLGHFEEGGDLRPLLTSIGYFDYKLKSDPEVRTSRHELDFYETPPWMVLPILQHVPLSGTIGECCVGHRAIADLLAIAKFKIWTNDLDPGKAADFHLDATKPESWETMPDADWIVTNPPYAEAASPIVQLAYEKAKKGIVMLLRQSWDEVCDDRIEFLKTHPPTTRISLPRYCFRKGKNGNWATDSSPVLIWVWEKSDCSGLTEQIYLGQNDLPLFHRTPEGLPSSDLVRSEIEKTMGVALIAPRHKKQAQPKTLAKIAKAVNKVIEANNKLPMERRWYISANLLVELARCRKEAAHEWIKENWETIKEANSGLNLYQNRGRNVKEIYLDLLL